MADPRKQTKEDFGEDFRYLVRIVNTDLDGKKNVVTALTGLKGVNDRLARIIARSAELPVDVRIGTLTDDQIAKLIETVDGVEDLLPMWMRNRRNDPESGDDAHLIGSEITLQLRDDMNRLKKIRSWRGVRHERGHPVRGQRTRSNGRTGITVGVQRKKK